MTVRRITILRRHPAIVHSAIEADTEPWCTCTHPRWHPVLLFDTIPLGCHECARCGRPDRAELGTTPAQLTR